MPKLNKWDLEALKNSERFEVQIKKIYQQAANEAAKIGASVTNFDPSIPFTFKDYPQTKKLVDKLMKDLAASVNLTINNGIETQWNLANQKNNELVNNAFGFDVSKRKGFEKYFNNRDSAQQAFKERTRSGLNLSDRVWNYTGQFKEEIEMAIDLGLGKGQSAAEMARDIKQYLNEPDKLFRRVRDKHGQLQLSKNAKSYNPGQGIYRSSYKNARRLAATETNIAYRSADKSRWDDLDFVVGIEIRLSNNHTLNGVPFVDICDDLKGKYPKDFTFIGWHPHCRCLAVPILKSQSEIDQDFETIISGGNTENVSENQVNDVPKQFKKYVGENKDRISEAIKRKKEAYWIKDNKQFVKELVR